MTKEERKQRQQLWRERVLAFRASGQNMAAWCREQQLKHHQLRYWLRRFAPATAMPADANTNWAFLRMADDDQLGDDVLQVSVGKAVITIKSGYDRALLTDVVRALMTLC